MGKPSIVPEWIEADSARKKDVVKFLRFSLGFLRDIEESNNVRFDLAKRDDLALRIVELLMDGESIVDIEASLAETVINFRR